MNESKAVQNLLKELRKLGWFEKISDRYKAGIPDILGCIEGAFVSVEVKIDTNTTTPLQRFNLFEIIKADGVALICTYSNKDRTYTINQNKFPNAREAALWIATEARSNINEMFSS